MDVVKGVCADFHFRQTVQLSSSQKFDLTREFLGGVFFFSANQQAG